MKAIVIDGYGGVDQLHLRELPDPRPQADEVLARVRAAGVNPVDGRFVRANCGSSCVPSFHSSLAATLLRSRLDWA
jgi:NADPH:quinone reductase-like Zn-dependent oxidoreductase